MSATNVTLLLRGLLVLFAQEGQTVGKVGILKYPPMRPDPDMEHKLTIRISRQPMTGPAPEPITLTRPEIRDALLLNIENAAQPTITIRNRNPVNRLLPPTDENKDSYRWFVDLENSELHDTPLDVNETELNPILTFNSGELYTAVKPNENILLVQKGIFADYADFGRVALAIGIDFLSTTRAVFTNGGEPVFDSATEPDTNYKIEITHDAEEHPPIVTDANHYYKALGSGLSPSQRILFMSIDEVALLKERSAEARLKKDKELGDAKEDILKKVRGEAVAPEAACFPTRLDRTGP